MTVRDVDSFSAHQADVALPEVAAERTALIVIDVLNDFVKPEGKMPMQHAERLFAPINRLLGAARAAGVRPVWVCSRHDSETEDALWRKRVPHCIAGSWGAEMPREMDVHPSDHVQPKRRYSGFFGTELAMWLRERGIERVVLCGLALNICVRSTAHDAFFHGFDVWVVRDACMGTGTREEEATLYDIATHYGTVVDAEVAIAAWGAA
jgi:ureidoacrylate peracid hydrolase